MLAIVSTVGFLLIVDMASKRVVPLENHRAEYYGITWFAMDSRLVASHSGLDNNTLVDIGSYALSEVGSLSIGDTETERFLSQPHQILCASDGRIVCTNTGRNCITLMDPRKPGHWQEVRLSPARWDRLSPDEQVGDHLNSVFERSGKLYVLAHGFRKGSELATFSYPAMELLARESITNRSGMHNIWVTRDGQRIGCHSEAGAVLDIGAGDILWEAGMPIYTRGLAATEEVVVVGESQKTARNDRRCSMSGLWILDRRSWSTLDYICMGPFGAVHEVRLLDHPDDAHHGHAFSGMSRLTSRDLREERAVERLALAAAAAAARVRWRGFDLVFGASAMDEAGFRHAVPDELCLAVRSGAGPNAEVAFDYALQPDASPSHVAAVIGYGGGGADTDMMALLLLAAGTSASASAWRHNGVNWLQMPDVERRALPIKGRAHLRPTHEGYGLVVDEALVLQLPAGEGGAPHGLSGIRWLNSAVRPALISHGRAER